MAIYARNTRYSVVLLAAISFGCRSASYVSSVKADDESSVAADSTTADDDAEATRLDELDQEASTQLSRANTDLDLLGSESDTAGESPVDSTMALDDVSEESTLGDDAPDADVEAIIVAATDDIDLVDQEIGSSDGGRRFGLTGVTSGLTPARAAAAKAKLDAKIADLNRVIAVLQKKKSALTAKRNGGKSPGGAMMCALINPNSGDILACKSITPSPGWSVAGSCNAAMSWSISQPTLSVYVPDGQCAQGAQMTRARMAGIADFYTSSSNNRIRSLLLGNN